jgi:hypothetical protein
MIVINIKKNQKAIINLIAFFLHLKNKSLKLFLLLQIKSTEEKPKNVPNNSYKIG